MQVLQVLWISHCGLTGLDGLNALPSLRELYAAFNKIDNLEPIAGKLHAQSLLRMYMTRQPACAVNAVSASYNDQIFFTIA